MKCFPDVSLHSLDFKAGEPFQKNEIHATPNEHDPRLVVGSMSSLRTLREPIKRVAVLEIFSHESLGTSPRVGWIGDVTEILSDERNRGSEATF